jgi:hypothetical protein
MPPQVAPEDEFSPSDLVVLDGVSMTPEEAAARQAAGTAGELGDDAALLRQATDAAAEERLGVLGQVQTAVEGAAAGLTFGGTRALNADDALAAYEERERQRVFAGTALLSEIGGAGLGALASGGTGLSGAVARLTPTGLVAARSAQFVGRGGTLLERAGRAVLAGAAEGAIEGAGNYVGQAALRGERIAGDALGAAALRGGALGGLLGGAAQPLAEGASAGARRLREAVLRRADDAAPPAGAAARPDDAPVRYDEVVPARAEDVDDARRALLGSIDDATRREVTREIDDLVQNPTFRNVTAGDDGALAARVEKRLRGAASEFQRSATAARDWGARYQAAIDAAPGTDVASRVAALPQDLVDEGAVHAARLAEAQFALDGALGKARARYLGQAPPAAAAPELSAAPAALGRRVASAGATALGALETADDLGLPVPTLSQLVGGPAGEALGWLMKIHAGANALKRRGLLPATPAVRAAREANGARSRLESALRRQVSPPAVPTGPALARYAQVARDVGELAARGEERARVSAELVDADGDVAVRAADAAQRGLDYLARTAPRNPLRASPFGADWKPPESALRTFARRVAVVRDPAGAVATILSDPGAVVELEALREVYPDVFAAARDAVARDADRLARDLSVAQRLFVGRAFGIPLSVTQVPGYATPAVVEPPRPVDLGASPNANNSPVADVERVGAGA